MKYRVFKRLNSSSLKETNKAISRHQQILSEYFETTNFNLKPENHDGNVKLLKQAMEIVYLRKVPLVSFDVEAYERSLKKITEIGFAIYDPELLKNSIFPHIILGHIIIDEHKRLLNKSFVPNNKHMFQGGVSYMATLRQSKKIMQQLFEEYINKRQGAFVGHNIAGDVKWLQEMGVKIADDIKTVDTSKLHSLSRKRNGTLRGVLRYLDIPHGYLHNAGNDAYYTLLAALSLCDPEVRINKLLDKFQDNEGIGKEKTRHYKFSDRVDVVESTKQGTLSVDQVILQSLLKNNSKQDNDVIVESDTKVKPSVVTDKEISEPCKPI